MVLGESCAGPGVGFHDPDQPLLTQYVLWFCDSVNIKVHLRTKINILFLGEKQVLAKPWGQLTPFCIAEAVIAVGTESKATGCIILQYNYDWTFFPSQWEAEKRRISKQVEISLIPLSEAPFFSQKQSHPKWDFMIQSISKLVCGFFSPIPSNKIKLKPTGRQGSDSSASWTGGMAGSPVNASKVS